MITHLVSPEAFQDDEVVVEGDAYRHLFRARRLAAGARVRVVDGDGRARWAEVKRIGRRQAWLVLGDDAPTNEPSYALTLVVAALRPERASWLVEKATEIGVAAVRFLACGRSPRQYGSGSLERWRRVAASAVEQCHRSRRPEVSGVHDWEEVPALLADSEERWFLDLEARADGNPSLVPVRGNREHRRSSGAVLVGPEGGWERAERKELLALGALPVHLGSRVLRVETAAVAVSAQILLPPLR